MTLLEACNVLHVDAGINDDLIFSLIDALPSYIEVTTGITEETQRAVSIPLLKTVEGFLLTQWYYADHADDQALTRTINALLKALTLKAKELNELAALDHAE